MKKEIKGLLTYNLITAIIFSFVSLYVNLNIWEKGQSIALLAIFDLSMYVVWAIAYFVGAVVLKRYGLVKVTMTTATISALMFMFMLLADSENQYFWVIVSGSMFGFMRGIHSAGLTLSLTLVAKGREFSTFFQFNDLFGRLSNIILPITFAFIVTEFGYEYSYATMLLLSISLIWFSKGLPPVDSKEIFGEEKLIDENFKFKNVYSGRRKYLLRSIIFGNSLIEFQILFVNVYTFQVTTNKYYVAALSIMYALIVMLAMVVHKKMKQKGTTWMTVGLVSSIIGAIILMTANGIAWQTVLGNVFLVIGTFFFKSNFFAQQYVAVEDLEDKNKYRSTVWREWMAMTSRFPMLILIIVLDHYFVQSTYMIWVMLLAYGTALTVPYWHKMMLKKG